MTTTAQKVEELQSTNEYLYVHLPCHQLITNVFITNIGYNGYIILVHIVRNDGKLSLIQDKVKSSYNRPSEVTVGYNVYGYKDFRFILFGPDG